MIVVKGKDVNVYVYDGSAYVIAVCATNISRRASANVVPLLTRGAGKTRIFASTTNEETVTLDGVRTLDQTSSFQVDDFVIGNSYPVRIIYLDSLGNQVKLEGTCLITGIDDSNGAADFSTYTVTMVRSGAWAKTVIIGGITQLDTPPSFSAVGVSSSEIDLSWLDVANESSYKIYFNGINDFGSSGLLVTLPANSISYAHTGLGASQPFWYWIIAVGDGITYSDSNPGAANASTLAISGPTTAILTEAGDYLTTETGDYLIQE
jgi:hypothetical protein